MLQYSTAREPGRVTHAHHCYFSFVARLNAGARSTIMLLDVCYVGNSRDCSLIHQTCNPPRPQLCNAPGVPVEISADSRLPAPSPSRLPSGERVLTSAQPAVANPAPSASQSRTTLCAVPPCRPLGAGRRSTRHLRRKRPIRHVWTLTPPLTAECRLPGVALAVPRELAPARAPPPLRPPTCPGACRGICANATP